MGILEDMLAQRGATGNLGQQTDQAPPPMPDPSGLPLNSPMPGSDQAQAQAAGDVMQRPSPPVLKRGGGVKAFLTNYVDNVASNLTGQPNAYERNQIEIRNQQNADRTASLDRERQSIDQLRQVQAQVQQQKAGTVLSKEAANELGVPWLSDKYIPSEVLAEINKQHLLQMQNKSKEDIAGAGNANRLDVAALVASAKTPTEIGLILRANAGDAEAQKALDTLEENRKQIAEARGQGYAQAKAQNTPFPTFDAEGNLVTTTQAKAIETGSPSASTYQSLYGPTSSTKTAGQAAGAVSSHIPSFRQSIDNLAAKGQLGAVQGRINEFLNQGYGGNDPDIAEFVTTLKLINSGTVRAHFGAKGGSNILDSFNRILNTSQEPKAIQGSLNAIDSFLKTYGDVGTLKGPRTTIPSRQSPVVRWGRDKDGKPIRLGQ